MAIEPQYLKKAAHDIRSPLQIFLSLISILKKVDLPDQLKGQADLANLAVERLKGVADRLDELAGF